MESCFWAWVLVVIVAAVWIGILSTSEDVYTGTKIEFNTSRDIQIDAETVTFEAASEDFFVLRKESGETIVGVPTARPLGWSHDEVLCGYFSRSIGWDGYFRMVQQP